jgi:hypothetical protein
MFSVPENSSSEYSWLTRVARVAMTRPDFYHVRQLEIYGIRACPHADTLATWQGAMRRGVPLAAPERSEQGVSVEIWRQRRQARPEEDLIQGFW